MVVLCSICISFEHKVIKLGVVNRFFRETGFSHVLVVITHCHANRHTYLRLSWFPISWYLGLPTQTRSSSNSKTVARYLSSRQRCPLCLSFSFGQLLPPLNSWLRNSFTNIHLSELFIKLQKILVYEWPFFDHQSLSFKEIILIFNYNYFYVVKLFIYNCHKLF